MELLLDVGLLASFPSGLTCVHPRADEADGTGGWDRERQDRWIGRVVVRHALVCFHLFV